MGSLPSESAPLFSTGSFLPFISMSSAVKPTTHKMCDLKRGGKEARAESGTLKGGKRNRIELVTKALGENSTF